MFDKRNISKEEAMRLACEENGLVYEKEGSIPREYITLVDETGKETIVNKKLEVVKNVDSVKATSVRVTNLPEDFGLVAIAYKDSSNIKGVDLKAVAKANTEILLRRGEAGNDSLKVIRKAASTHRARRSKSNINSQQSKSRPAN